MTIDHICWACHRPATTLDSEGDPSCVYCKRVEDAHACEWEDFDEADGVRVWDAKRRQKYRREAFNRRLGVKERGEMEISTPHSASFA